MRALFVACVVTSPLVVLGACSSFSTSSGEAPPDAAAPIDAAADDADGSVAADARGPFCVEDSGSYDRCWDFSTDRLNEGFDDPNHVEDYIVRRDLTTFTSAPGSWFSEVQAAPGKQSAARYIARLGAIKDGTYKVTFDVRLDTECPSGSIIELYCTTLDSEPNRGSMMRVVPRNGGLEFQVQHNGNGGSSFARSDTKTLPITLGTWTHVEVEVNAGASGSARFLAGDQQVESAPNIPIRCVGMTGISLLVGVQGTLPASTRCAAWFDDVTVSLP